jgi:Flp pilus assembly pilin Flp
VDHFLTMLRNDEGATLVLYGLVVSLIAVGAIAAIGALGGQLANTLTHTNHLARSA